MNIIIIEDEIFLAENLKEIILSIRPDYQISKLLSSVEEAVEYLSGDAEYNLIFSDISLGDGLSFEIFSKIKVRCPIIFCTAHENYAVKAFETNGIDFVLKPILVDRIEQAITKIEQLEFHFSQQQQKLEAMLGLYTNDNSIPKPILVHYRDELIPFDLKDIALFYIKHEQTFLVSLHGQQYLVNHSLEELEKKVDQNFFRANRQVLVNRKIVASISKEISRKLTLVLNINFPEVITISKEKASTFVRWLSGKE